MRENAKLKIKLVKPLKAAEAWLELRTVSFFRFQGKRANSRVVEGAQKS